MVSAFVIASLLLGCTSTTPPHTTATPHSPELREMDSRVKSLEKELQAEREKVKELTTQLQALRPLVTGQSVPIAEIVAVPEEYLGKEILIEGEVAYRPSFREHVSYFILKDLKSKNTLQCYFKTQELDRDSRRLLVNKGLGQKIKITGQLARTTAGLASQIRMRPERGYEFHVSKVIN